MTSEDLPEPLTPVTATNAPSGKWTSTFSRLCCRAPMTAERRPSGRRRLVARRLAGEAVAAMRRFVGTGIASLPDRYLPGERVLRLQHLLRRARGGDLAAAVAGAGAEVEQVVGGRDHLAVVLDEDQRVAEVAEALQCLQQPGVVARVQADGRLVEDVEHAGQAAADLGRQADALGLAAGERRPGPAEREVVEADIDEELQPVA